MLDRSIHGSDERGTLTPDSRIEKREVYIEINEENQREEVIII